MQYSKDDSLNLLYDAFGRLLKKNEVVKGKKPASTRYFYLGNNEIGSLSPAKKIEILKVLGFNGNHISHLSVAFELNNEIYVPLHDVEGNVQVLIDPFLRKIVERYEYSLFGDTIILDANHYEREKSFCQNPWMFSEKRVDVIPEFVFFGLRFYDTQTGKWVTPDPLGNVDGLNQYSFVHNNPVNLFDRFGLNSESKKCHHRQEPGTQWLCSICGGSHGGSENSSKWLPTITYDDHFEKLHKDYRSENQIIENCFPPSSCYDLSGEGFLELPPDLGIGFINGIWNNFNAAKESARYIAKLSGGYNIRGVHNATHGTFIDLLECYLGLKFVATEPVGLLHKMWYDFFNNSSENAKFLMICHSQGAIHVRNALLDFPPELRERILVVAIAPAGYMYKETCADVMHYRASAMRDFVPRIDQEGAQRAKETVLQLNSHPNAASFDHEFSSPTYKETIYNHVSNYINSNGKGL